LREPFVTVVLGETWLGAVPIIAWLAPTGYLQSLVSTLGTVLMATGRTDILRTIGAVNAALYLVSFIIGLSDGAVGVARAYFFANIAAAVLSFHYTLRLVKLNLGDAFFAIAHSLFGAIAMAVLVASLEHWLVPETGSAIFRLASLALIGATLYAGLLVVISPDSFRQMKRLLSERVH
jgi:PST family polysaccharide transporter